MDKIMIDGFAYANGEETTAYDYIVNSSLDGFILAHGKRSDRMVYINKDTIERIYISDSAEGK